MVLPDMMSEVVAPAGRAHFQMFAQDGASPVRWRLLSGNNRELGRGVGEFAGIEACRAGIRQLQRVVTQLEGVVQRDGGGWSWVLSLGGVPVSTSGHPYDRLIRCRQGLEHFVRQFGDGEVSNTVMLTQSRRWTGGSRTVLHGPRGRS